MESAMGQRKQSRSKVRVKRAASKADMRRSMPRIERWLNVYPDGDDQVLYISHLTRALADTGMDERFCLYRLHVIYKPSVHPGG
jgi:hypothetical protein